MTSQHQYHIVYKTINMVTNQYYIGVHSTYNLTDSYLGSGNRLKHSVKKYGRPCFTREIITLCETRTGALQVEYNMLTPTVIQDPLCLNISVGGKGNPNGGHAISDEAKQKLSLLKTGVPKSELTKQRISQSKKGMSSPTKGRSRPESERLAISNKMKGKPKSEEHKQKLREATLKHYEKKRNASN